VGSCRIQACTRSDCIVSLNLNQEFPGPWTGQFTSDLLHQKAVVSKLLAWHKWNFERYPFRNEKDPYKILISEIMLRQTTAQQVSKVYPQFVKKYPDFHALAEADAKELRILIKSLGLRSRASNLLEIARSIQMRYGGILPRSSKILVSLPGVGEYIANAVVTKAYAQRRPLVDSNINRVFARIFNAKEKVAAEVAEAHFMELLQYAKPERLNYAFIDLAHSVCTYRKPRCLLCPVREECLYVSLA
jgi:A/G-specific adenine glycosylase